MSAKGSPERLHEMAALGLATLVFTNRPGSHVVVQPSEMTPGFIYDFVDPATETVGQCWLRDNSTADKLEWGQDPRGVSPVVLQWSKARPERARRVEREADETASVSQ